MARTLTNRSKLKIAFEQCYWWISNGAVIFWNDEFWTKINKISIEYFLLITASNSHTWAYEMKIYFDVLLNQFVEFVPIKKSSDKVVYRLFLSVLEKKYIALRDLVSLVLKTKKSRKPISLCKGPITGKLYTFLLAGFWIIFYCVMIVWFVRSRNQLRK